LIRVEVLFIARFSERPPRRHCACDVKTGWMVMMLGFLRLQSLSRSNEGLTEEFANLIRRAAANEQFDVLRAHLPGEERYPSEEEDVLGLPPRQAAARTQASDKPATANEHTDDTSSTKGGSRPPSGRPARLK
jgi:hypothetical protein